MRAEENSGRESVAPEEETREEEEEGEAETIDGAATRGRAIEAIGAAALAARTTAAARGDFDDLKTEMPDDCALRATEESISFLARGERESRKVKNREKRVSLFFFSKLCNKKTASPFSPSFPSDDSSPGKKAGRKAKTGARPPPPQRGVGASVSPLASLYSPIPGSTNRNSTQPNPTPMTEYHAARLAQNRKPRRPW